MATAAIKTRVEHQQMAVIEQPSDFRRLDQIHIILDDGTPPDNQISIITSAVEVHQQAENLKKNALNLCVALYNCKTSYSRVSGSSAGWPAFCKRNFESIGLSDGNIRACIRTGEALVGFTNADPDALAAYSRLSRAALMALGETTPEIAEEVKLTLQMDPANAPTAKEIRTLNDTIESQRSALAQSEEAIRRANEYSADLNSRLSSTEDEVIALRTENAGLEKKVKTPVEALVPTLPKGVKTEADLLDSINKQIVEGKQQLDHTAKQSEVATKELTAIQRKLALATQQQATLDDLQNDLTAMLAKYPLALAEKMNAAAPDIKSRLKKIAADMRLFADQIDVT